MESEASLFWIYLAPGGASPGSIVKPWIFSIISLWHQKQCLGEGGRMNTSQFSARLLCLVFSSRLLSCPWTAPVPLQLSTSGQCLCLAFGCSRDGTQQGGDKLSFFQREDQRPKTPALQTCLQPPHNALDTMAGKKFCNEIDTQQWVQGKIWPAENLAD